MTGVQSELEAELEAALRDLADFERRVVLVEADIHRLREMAEGFEAAHWIAEALASYRLAGEEELAMLLESRQPGLHRRRPVAAPVAPVVPSEGPYTLVEELTIALQGGGDEGIAGFFASKFSAALRGEDLAPWTLIQAAAKLEASQGPLHSLRIELAASLLCLGEDGAAYQILTREVAAPTASLRARKLMADTLEARGRVAEARTLYQSMAGEQVDYPGVQAALRRLSRAAEVGTRYLVSQAHHPHAPSVVVARDVQLGREVVLKNYACDAAVAQLRIARELEVRERVPHPAFVMVLDVDPSHASLVLEALSGALSDSPAARDHASTLSHWCTLFDALAALHGEGLVHGRIDAGHILFSQDRGFVLSGLSGVHDRLEEAPEDVIALAKLVESHVSAPQLDDFAEIVRLATSPDASARPSAQALARGLSASSFPVL